MPHPATVLAQSSDTPNPGTSRLMGRISFIALALIVVLLIAKAVGKKRK